MNIQQAFPKLFTEYSSYVILHRGIPSAVDGLKPVQRRILHAMYSSNDGRYSKVANIVGDTMKYHPHGDASIYSALVNIGQKDILVDTQGNWGNILTGDNAAAARYIEARLTPIAKEFGFNPKITNWLESYDGRNKEPNELPMKIPILLMSGAEGIGVGLRTMIMPHNPIELCDAAIACINNEPYQLIPDFPTGGILDATKYDSGKSGGKLRVRAKMKPAENIKNCIEIYEVPYTRTTQQLIESIQKMAKAEKLPIRKIEDNTAKTASILVFLDKNEDLTAVEQGLYALTDCEISISPDCWVIKDEKPINPTVEELLKWNVIQTKQYIKSEFEILLTELQEKKRKCIIEKIFIENKFYEVITQAISRTELAKYVDAFMIPACESEAKIIGFDIQYKPSEEGESKWLASIPFRRLSKFDSSEANSQILELNKQISRTNTKLKNIKQETIKHFIKVKEAFKTYTRKTQIREFKTKNMANLARTVVKDNLTLYVNKTEGMIGTNPKIGEEITTCSDVSLIATLNNQGIFQVATIEAKKFVNKELLELYIDKPDSNPIFTMVYIDDNGITYAKRFRSDTYVRNKNYIITKSKKPGTVLFSALSEENNKLPLVEINLDPSTSARKKVLQFDLNAIPIKNKNAGGNIVTKHKVKSITKK